ncbi:succinate dehydrogenase [Ascidiaceihabitans sp.]|uniref:succinate dehydrogenase n=1 Tax=Ascidiaceihabitans sp. TaxID=1872644 RepID=UPI003298659E
MSKPTITSRAHPLWLAYVLHRLSGIGLALFLPLHFLLLGQALHGAAALDAGLHFSAMFVFKLAEFGLVFLLAVHLFGGLRLMAMEWLPWTPPQKTLAALATATAFAVACLFFMKAI